MKQNVHGCLQPVELPKLSELSFPLPFCYKWLWLYIIQFLNTARDLCVSGLNWGIGNWLNGQEKVKRKLVFFVVVVNTQKMVTLPLQLLESIIRKSCESGTSAFMLCAFAARVCQHFLSGMFWVWGEEFSDQLKGQSKIVTIPHRWIYLMADSILHKERLLIAFFDLKQS